MHIDLLCNTEDAVLFRNIEANSRRDVEWISAQEAHDGHAVIVGGGPSLVDSLDAIRWRKSIGQRVFALNGAGKFLAQHGIKADYIVIIDARPGNIAFLDSPGQRLLASQCDPSLFDAGPAVLWHPKMDDIESHLPDERETLTLIGGGTTVGLSSMCLAYTMGYRKLHLFGYDSSHRETGHAYAQPMNVGEPVCKVTVFGKTFIASLAMAKQAEFFPTVCDNLIDLGCVITVEGDGLLPYMTRQIAKRATWTEQDKYEAMWAFGEYRVVSPGELVAETFVKIARPEGTVIDFGCGTGRGSLVIEKLTECKLLLIDFTSNSRDPEALRLPFLQHDLTQAIPAKGNFGFCTDVMEHIPPQDVDSVIRNVMASCRETFFQISLVPDSMGGLIGHPLHLSVHPFEWWADVFRRLGFQIAWSADQGSSAMFLVSTT
jgi:uncharacterized Rossmann fold enzyme